MKMNRDREYYLRRATKGFKTLVVYFCVTRPQYETAYHKDGKFSKKELMRQMDFLSNWKSRSRREKELLAKNYATYSRTFNYTFDIPRKLVSDVLGAYQDETGKLVRIHCDEVVDKLVADGFIDKVNHGTRGKVDDDGNYKVKAYWTNKYLLANRDYWLKLLADPKYSDYTKYPLDDEGFVLRAIKIIAKYRKKTIPQKPAQERDEKKSAPTTPREKFKERLIKELEDGFVRGLADDCTVERELARVKFSQNEIDVIMSRLRRLRKEHLEGKMVSAPVEKVRSREELNALCAAIWADLRAKKICNLSGVLERFAMLGVQLTNEQRNKVEACYCKIRYGVPASKTTQANEVKNNDTENN